MGVKWVLAFWHNGFNGAKDNRAKHPQQAKEVAASGLTLRQPQDLAGFVEDIFGERK